MNVDFTKGFDKQFAKLPRKRQEKVRATIALFLQDASTQARGRWDKQEILKPAK